MHKPREGTTVNPDEYNPDLDIYVVDEEDADQEAIKLAALIFHTTGEAAVGELARLAVESSPKYMQEIAGRAIAMAGYYAAFGTAPDTLRLRHTMRNLDRFVRAANFIAHRYGIGGSD